MQCLKLGLCAIAVAGGFAGSVSAATLGLFPTVLSTNTTGQAASVYTGAPDDTYAGIGGQTVIYDFGNYRIVNAAGNDFNVYEVDFGAVEFSLTTVAVSIDGVTFVDVTASGAAALDLDGDEAHGNASFRRSYDLGALSEARFLRIDGNGSGAAGGNNGFDLDAVGAGNYRLVQTGVVPLPATLPLLIAGFAGLALVRRRGR
jgi:hypothetical protein